MQKHTHWQLLCAFMKIGLFTFGGGYAMIAMIEHDCVERKQWITHEEMMQMTVIAESTPGPIAINCATYVGYRQGGLWGAIVATLGIVLPSFTILYAISLCLDRFLAMTIIAKAFRGIQLGVGVLIVDVAVGMIRKMPAKPLPRAIMAGAAAAMLVIHLCGLPVSSISVMLAAAAVSLAVFAFRGAPARKGGMKP